MPQMTTTFVVSVPWLRPSGPEPFFYYISESQPLWLGFNSYEVIGNIKVKYNQRLFNSAEEMASSLGPSQVASGFMDMWEFSDVRIHGHLGALR